MRFWDSSAVVPLLLDEDSAERLRGLYRSDPQVAVWWATEVECVSAISRRERAGQLDSRDADEAFGRLRDLAAEWAEIAPSTAVRRTASRVLRVHDLRAVDALQLAAAIVACENRPETLELVTLDERLALAANREGFPVPAP